MRSLRARKSVTLGGTALAFDPKSGLIWDPLAADLPHPNTIDFELLDATGTVLRPARYLSVGGGFVERLDARRAHAAGQRGQIDRPPAAPLSLRRRTDAHQQAHEARLEPDRAGQRAGQLGPR